ncbi:hypothetical protein ACTXT7_008417 [Hymenolepis weldensis]
MGKQLKSYVQNSDFMVHPLNYCAKSLLRYSTLINHLINENTRYGVFQEIRTLIKKIKAKNAFYTMENGEQEAVIFPKSKNER